MMSSHNFVSGSAVVIRNDILPYELKEILKGFEAGEVYQVQDVKIFPKTTLLPREFIKAGYIPDQYAPHLIKGITTTNHDTIGSDRFVTVKGRQLSGAWFRSATAEEVNRHAKTIL